MLNRLEEIEKVIYIASGADKKLDYKFYKAVKECRQQNSPDETCKAARQYASKADEAFAESNKFLRLFANGSYGIAIPKFQRLLQQVKNDPIKYEKIKAEVDSLQEGFQKRLDKKCQEEDFINMWNDKGKEYRHISDPLRRSCIKPYETN